MTAYLVTHSEPECLSDGLLAPEVSYLSKETSLARECSLKSWMRLFNILKCSSFGPN